MEVQKNLRWLGHVHRMENDRSPRQLFTLSSVRVNKALEGQD